MGATGLGYFRFELWWKLNITEVVTRNELQTRFSELPVGPRSFTNLD